MRSVVFTLFSMGILALVIYGQNIQQDARKALADEWSKSPENCIKALEDVRQGKSAAEAMADLDKGLMGNDLDIVKGISDAPDFWLTVVQAGATHDCGKAGEAIQWLYV